MIKEVKINNFKSVADLTLPLSRFNVLIGSNGSGKSNILEAIAFGAAASADKLDNEFLGARGIRIANVHLMKSAFTKDGVLKPIQIDFQIGDKDVEFTLEYIEAPILKWIIKEKEDISKFHDSFLPLLLLDIESHKNKLYTMPGGLGERFLIIKKDLDDAIRAGNVKQISELISQIISKDSIDLYYSKQFGQNILSNFIIYSPEISSLRKFEEESQIKPLGVKGEGLFSILQIFYESYGPETIDEIRNYLHIIEWFDDFEAIFDKVSGRNSLVVKDRNMPGVTLNQTNVNEGFLYLLFYISLIISKETPAFFAIDNIEAALHPRLCEELIKNLVALSKTHNKQIILTTHNPFILDGLNLSDPEQKLFVVRRNGEGETIADDISPIEGVKLSEAWMRGYIGGQPETIE